MAALIYTSAENPRETLELLKRALDGGTALGLGMVGTDGGTFPLPEGTAVVIATSGSTGTPKRVILSAEALRASAKASRARIGSGAWLLAVPAGYIAGVQVLVRSVLSGISPAFVDGSFTAQAFVDAAASLRGDRYTSLVPAQLAKLLHNAKAPGVLSALRSFRAILVGGQTLPGALRDAASDIGVNVVRTYGATETSGGCVYDGSPLDGVAVRSIGGELRIAGSVLADGYLGDPQQTSRAFASDDLGLRWYRTGDLGVVSGGKVSVQGRVDNVIVSGGINISLDRVEHLVRSVPGLEEAVVVAVKDERWGEASVVVAPCGEALRRGEDDPLARVREVVSAALGRPARPAHLLIVDELKTLPSGKPDREAIRAALGFSSAE